MNPISRYVRWLHTRWPAGTIEKLPDVREDFSTNVPGLYVVGDLTGIPLLKLSADSGARAAAAIAKELESDRGVPGGREVVDVAIVGGGVSGMAAALEARRLGLSFLLLEASEPFSTIVNFPRRKPIYTYPTEMTPAGELQFSEAADVKESLLDELRAQTLERGVAPVAARVERVRKSDGRFEIVVAGGTPRLARRVVVAIGRSGNFRRLGVPGEERDKVANRLHDPKDFADRDVLVVGGGDSALETAIALAQGGARVTLSYRKPEFSRPKPDNVEKLAALVADPMADVAIERPTSERVTTSSGAFLGAHRKAGSIELMMSSRVTSIAADEATIEDEDGVEKKIPNDAVFAMIGREPPLDFFRRSGVAIRGEWRARTWIGLAAMLLACIFIYNWKAGGTLNATFQEHAWFPYGLKSKLGDWPTLADALGQPGFYYSLAYCLAVVAFGFRRVRRRRTPYVRRQTWTLAAFQVVPLFVLPYFLLPWMGHAGWFDDGLGRTFADSFFPDSGGSREYWRAFGFVLAWPLFIWNLFTWQPLWGWLILSLVQTAVIIPLLVLKFGKGAYCGWVCSCGALAETLGDAHRQKMPHGPFWNRLNLVGQVLLIVCLGLFGLRVAGWIWPGSLAERLFSGLLSGYTVAGVQTNYYWAVDVLLAGILGAALYFHFSGRVWCRFACPLAALMHVYARFSRFRIFADKKKCISCNVCTSVCHQGIDVMNFANKGQPMEDPQCVRCSACVQSCPTGVLRFGEIDPRSGEAKFDRLPASPVLMREEKRG